MTEPLKVAPRGRFRFCPLCSHPLLEREFVGDEEWWLDGPLATDASGATKCQRCGWVHYDNPTPVAAVLASQMGDPARGVVMVKRGIEPFKGGWCLPCGYVNRHEIPKAAACREMQEETGLAVRLEKILCVCNPMPGEVNQITISYLARIVGGDLKPGDDAAEAQVFGREHCPTPCFRSHKMLVEKWWAGRLGDLTGVDLD